MKLVTRLLAACLLAAACTPKSEPELDGAPKEAPAVPDDGSLAGGPSAPSVSADAVLPGVIDLVLPAGAITLKDCQTIVAADYDKPPAMTCVALLGNGALAVRADSETDSHLLDAMASAGWKSVRTMGAERYFERVKGQTDCADIAVLTALEGKTLAAVLKAAAAPPPPADLSWRAYAIPASTHAACGADRMKP